VQRPSVEKYWPGSSSAVHVPGKVLAGVIKCKLRQYGPLSITDGDVISMPAVFRRHVVGKCFHCDIAEMRFIGKTVIT